MLNFKSFLLTEAKKESKSGEAANTNGVRHELMTLGVLNHMAKHHGSVKGKSGKEYPNLLKMNNDELHNFYHKNVATGDFNEEMPEHFRDKDGQRPDQVFHKHNHKIDHDELFNHFKNSVEHVNKLHHHLREQGLVPESVHNISWTSKDGDVNQFMRKHGEDKNRQQNKEGDDFDGMFSIKDKDGNVKHTGLSMKWGSKKGAKPTLKNNTNNSVFGENNRGDLSPEYQDVADKFHHNTAKHIDNFVEKVKKHYNHESDAARGREYREHDDAEQSNPGSSSPSVQKKLHAVEQHNLERNHNTAKELHSALSEINDREKQKNSTKEISNYIRRKASISSPDVVPIRSSMTINPKNNVADSHHFEDHSTHLNHILGNTHHFNISNSGGQVHIDAHDKDGKHLYRFSQWSKAGSRKIDKTTKILSNQSGADPSKDENKKPSEKLAQVKPTTAKKPTTKKEKKMNPAENNPHWDNKVNEMLDKVMKNNLVESTDTFKSVLASKISQKLLETKRGIYSERYDKDLDANKNGKIDAEDFKKLRAKKKHNHKCTASCNEQAIEDALNEVLNPSMGVKAYIDDFIKSDDSRFKGDSKEKRRQRAIAAFYNDKNK